MVRADTPPFDGLSVVEDDRQSRDCLFVHADHRRAAAAPLLPPYPTTYFKSRRTLLESIWDQS